MILNEKEIQNELENLRSAWKYRGEVFYAPEKYVGFVYIIENNITARKYIGRKLFTKAKSIQRSGKKVKSRVVSDWDNYWGSSEELKKDVNELGKENFSRTILHLCNTKSDLNYLETLEIFRRGALLTDDFYNKWCSFKGNAKYIKLTENP
jgi:hypothetical protein